IVEDDELIGRMRRSSMLLNAQLRDLLTLAKGQAGYLEMHPEPFDACTLIDGVAQAAIHSAQSKGLRLTVHRPDQAFFVVADGARIDQIVTNLVVNSVGYTDSGEVILTLHPYDAEAKGIRLEVADTGPGIPPAMVPTLLEPDKLLSNTARKGTGSGIGLAIVKTLVDHLGGRISVSSVEGQGTAFDVFIPAELIDPETLPADATQEPRRILVVDDREDILVGLTSVLNELGYACDCAQTAPVATNLLAARRYHAVLLDIQMPTKSGAELAAETRRGQGPNRASRLLGMSAAEVTAKYGQGPFDACLTKPIDRNALVSALSPEWPDSWPATFPEGPRPVVTTPAHT
ncbi:MAG: ATP-binding protein, partial [Caldimonas sp.]